MNIKLKKIILYISLLPYAYLILSSLYYAIFGYTYNYTGTGTIYGIEAFFDNITNGFWWDNFINFNFIGFLGTCCIGYQLWYFINIKSEKIPISRKLNYKKIFFVISLAPWIIYFLSGVYALLFGYEVGFFAKNTVYGFEAFEAAMSWNLMKFTLIPVLPITLIYSIIYLISQRKSDK